MTLKVAKIWPAHRIEVTSTGNSYIVSILETNVSVSLFENFNRNKAEPKVNIQQEHILLWNMLKTCELIRGYKLTALHGSGSSSNC